MLNQRLASSIDPTESNDGAEEARLLIVTVLSEHEKTRPDGGIRQDRVVVIDLYCLSLIAN